MKTFLLRISCGALAVAILLAAAGCGDSSGGKEETAGEAVVTETAEFTTFDETEIVNEDELFTEEDSETTAAEAEDEPTLFIPAEDESGEETQAAADLPAVAPAEPSTQSQAIAAETEQVRQDYVLNTNTMKIHYPWCSSVSDISPKNKEEVVGTLAEFEAQGYVPCGRCTPH